jgi:cell division protein FtsI/penicillin-binding protein 2
MRRFTIVAMALLFVFVGVQRAAQAEEKQATEKQSTQVETNEEAKAKTETDRKIKELAEEVKRHAMKDSIEPAKGKSKAAGGRESKAPRNN